MKRRKSKLRLDVNFESDVFFFVLRSMYVDLHYTRVLFYHTLMEEAPEILKEVSSVSLFVLLCVCLSFTKLQFTF